MAAVFEALDLRKTYMLGKVPVEDLRGVKHSRKGRFSRDSRTPGSGKSTFLNLFGALDKPTSIILLTDRVDVYKRYLCPLPLLGGLRNMPVDALRYE